MFKSAVDQWKNNNSVLHLHKKINAKKVYRYLSWWIEDEVRLSHTVVTFEVNHDSQTYYCKSPSGTKADWVNWVRLLISNTIAFLHLSLVY